MKSEIKAFLINSLFKQKKNDIKDASFKKKVVFYYNATKMFSTFEINEIF